MRVIPGFRIAALIAFGVVFGDAHPQRVAAAALLPQQKHLVDGIDRHFPEQVAYLERIVNQNSETMNFEGVAAVGATFVSDLKSLGFDARWEDLRASVNRAGHVIATRQGPVGKRLLLIGHIDTVHAKTSPFNRFIREGDRATGPGTEDMKNGATVMLYALKALNARGLLEGRSIVVILTGDEEMPADDLAMSRATMIDAARHSDVVLSFEPGEPGVVVTSRRGFTAWELEVTGKQAHSGTIFSDSTGAGAVFEAARILSRFYDTLRDDPQLTFNAGSMACGTDVDFDARTNRGSVFGKNNVVPRTCRVMGEMRTISAAQEARTKANMQAIVGSHLPHTDAEMHFQEGYPPMEEKPGNLNLQRQLSAISVALGAGPLAPNDPVTRGAGDISVVANTVAGALDGLGGSGGGAHSSDEFVDLKAMQVATQRAALLMAELTARR